ncbi:calcium-binding protein [Pseudomonas sp. CFBP 13711]|uniref:calcium-binding protein n=1 Tax=unclassified Pseudomonas TaxID=196821 RepID=UPI0017823760|nr:MULTISPECIES: calcium-binding protein [unclassified Pseudomonas]MBD8708816.1 calcium-binding protein [Pseudomonas sp. CFBP 13711]MBD8713686.1 calcium-binding protein [Pseudomonas sp. CFBP 13715]
MASRDSKPTIDYTVRTGPGTVQVDPSTGADQTWSIILQPDGKILVGGESFQTAIGYPGSPGDESYGTRGSFTSVRLNSDGSLDSSFSQDGIALVPASLDPEDEAYYVMAVQADGKVLSAQPGLGGLKVERFNLDGTLDTTFGKGGAAALDVPISTDGMAIYATADGSVYVSARGTSQAVVFKLDSSGTPAENIGVDGTLVLNPTGYYGTGNIATVVQPDGSVLLGSWLYVGSEGPHDPGDPVYAVQRLAADGNLDTTFGVDGVVYFDTALGLDYRAAMTVQADGKIIIAGESHDSTTFNVLRLNADGAFDTSFSGDGKLTLQVPQGDSAYAHSAIVQPDGKILIAGDVITRLNADGSLDTTFGSQDGQYHVDGSSEANHLIGNDTAEIIRGLGGDDVLQGAGGRDVLTGGMGADIFRFSQISDSYRTATETGSDRILDFDASQDRVDLIALGFTGIGDGHNGTLAIQANADGTRTYLKSFDANVDGQRFELALEGNLTGQLNSNNLVFTAPTVEGTAGKDVITGSAMSEVIYGLAGNDRIDGGRGSDVIIGGAGADLLSGGDDPNLSVYGRDGINDADVFRYTAASDSYRTDSQSFVDLIVRFANNNDKIDVSALGYTGFGDGTGTTLKMIYNDDLDRTYLKDVEADAQGHRFEIALTGDWTLDLRNSDMIFAQAQEVTLVGMASEAALG